MRDDARTLWEYMRETEVEIKRDDATDEDTYGTDFSRDLIKPATPLLRQT